MWLLVTSAARRLDLSSDQVRRLVDSGKLKATHAAGGVRLIDGDDVERLARERGRAQILTAAVDGAGDEAAK
jgi:excisionase family DNA binding protein